MKVLLLKDIKKMGNRGDIIEVADGYANSYMIPRGLAKKGTDREEHQAVQAKKAQKEKIQQKEADQLNQFKKFNKKTVSFVVSTGQSGKLFTAISSSDISGKLPGLNPADLKIKKGIKELGQHEVPYQVGPNKGNITVSVQRE